MEKKVERPSMAMKDANQFTPSSFTKPIPPKLVPQIEETWPRVKSALESSGISCRLDRAAQSSMTISTTRNYTGDQLVNLKTATVLIILLSKGAPIESAMKVLDVGRKSTQLDVIRLSGELGGLCAEYKISKKKYSERSKQLVSGGTLEELRRLANCGLLFHHAGLVVATGPREGLKLVNRIVKDCIVRGVPPRARIRELRMKGVINDLGGLRF